MSIEVTAQVSSSFLFEPSVAYDSLTLCKIKFSCLFSFSFFSALTNEAAMLATESAAMPWLAFTVTSFELFLVSSND